MKLASLLANQTIETKLRLMVGSALLGFTLFGTFAYYTMTVVKVTGPYYQRIAQSKDLIADILPPPEARTNKLLSPYRIVAREGWLGLAYVEGRILATE